MEERFTVLAGCNGSGKTTLLSCIKEELEKTKTPLLRYDNLSDGGSGSISELLYSGDMGLGASMWCSSEGERIGINMARIVAQIREFILTGETDKSKKDAKWRRMFGVDETPAVATSERWILLDAVDSGLSIDGIAEVKDILKLAIKDAGRSGINLFVVAAANSYELARGERCLDVTNGKELRFSDYEEYRAFILKSREKKEKRDEMAANKRRNEKEG